MKVTNVEFTPYVSKKMRSWVDITFDDDMTVTGWKIIEGDQGLFLSKPSNKKGDQYYPIVKFPNDDFANYVQDEVLSHYGKNSKEPAGSRTRQARLKGRFDDDTLGDPPIY